MRETMVIFRRELTSYFLSPIAYVFGALLLVLVGYFTYSLEPNTPATMQGFFGLLPIAFAFFLPALTMRLWAEEKKLGTIELLMTFPITVPQMILGKFLAAVAYLCLVLALTLPYPIVLSIYGNLDWGPVIGGYVATVLMASVYVAAGMLFSSFTREQIVAWLLALFLLLVLTIIGHPMVQLGLAGVLPSAVIAVFNAISPYTYFSSVTRGVLDTRDLIYFALFCAFFLYTNGLVLHGKRLKG